MTSETKIGLVVGLGFIVTFAVILSKKAAVSPYALLEEDITLGEEGMVSVVKASRPDAESKGAAGSAVAVSDLPTRQDRSPSDDAVRTPHVRPGAEKQDHAGRVSPKGATGGPSQNALAEKPFEDGTGIDEIPLPSMAGEKAASAKKKTETGGLVTIEMVIPPQEPVSTRAASTSPGATPAPRPESPDVVVPKQAPSDKKPASPPEIRPSVKEYIAKAGDSLMKIAKLSYGVETPEAVEKIYEANQKLLKDRHTLKVGQKLVIPAWVPAGQGELAQSFPGAGVHSEIQKSEDAEPDVKVVSAHKPVEAAEKIEKIGMDKKVPAEKGAASKEYRMYTVKEHDTFSTIAQSEMGTSKLWNELYTLNKDKFPRPESLRVGALIRVPANVLASNGSESDQAAEE